MLGPGHISHTVKMNYFFLNLLFYPQAYIRQTEAIVMPFEGTQILNFIFFFKILLFTPFTDQPNREVSNDY